MPKHTKDEEDYVYVYDEEESRYDATSRFSRRGDQSPSPVRGPCSKCDATAGTDHASVKTVRPGRPTRRLSCGNCVTSLTKIPNPSLQPPYAPTSVTAAELSIPPQAQHWMDGIENDNAGPARGRTEHRRTSSRQRIPMHLPVKRAGDHEDPTGYSHRFRARSTLARQQKAKSSGQTKADQTSVEGNELTVGYKKSVEGVVVNGQITCRDFAEPHTGNDQHSP